MSEAISRARDRLISAKEVLAERWTRLPKWGRWAIIGGSAAAAFAGITLISRRASGATMSIPGGGIKTWTDEDIEYLARVLIMETGLIRDRTEMAGIAWVAVNRALMGWGRSYPKNSPIKTVVSGTHWPGGGPRGNSFVEAIQMDSPGKTAYHSAPVGHKNIQKARDFAKNILTGKIPNPIGPRRSFLHPGGMGGRPLPSWIISKKNGGTAANEPLALAGAIFA